MKVETGSFSANTSSITLLLNDDTINVKGVYFQISPDSTTVGEASTGFSDGVRHRAKSLLVTGTKRESKRSTSYGITHYKDVSGTTTRKIAGKVDSGGFSTAGEIAMTFDNYDATISIDYMVFGD